jgi:hypothetical protein
MRKLDLGPRNSQEKEYLNRIIVAVQYRQSNDYSVRETGERNKQSDRQAVLWVSNQADSLKEYADRLKG